VGKSIFLVPGQFPGEYGDDIKADFPPVWHCLFCQPMASGMLDPLLLAHGNGAKSLLEPRSPLDLDKGQPSGIGDDQIDLAHRRLVAALQYPIAVSHQKDRRDSFRSRTSAIGLLALLVHFDQSSQKNATPFSKKNWVTIRINPNRLKTPRNSAVLAN